LAQHERVNTLLTFQHFLQDGSLHIVVASELVEISLQLFNDFLKLYVSVSLFLVPSVLIECQVRLLPDILSARRFIIGIIGIDILCILVCASFF